MTGLDERRATLSGKFVQLRGSVHGICYDAESAVSMCGRFYT